MDLIGIRSAIRDPLLPELKAMQVELRLQGERLDVQLRTGSEGP